MQNLESVRHWDAYWRANTQQAAYDDFGAHRDALASFWQTLLIKALHKRPDASLLDIATGNGAVLEFAQAAATGTDMESAADNALKLVAMDYSFPAISDLKQRFPTVHGVVADAAHPPFQPASFDIVCSQYGAEYAGPKALNTAASQVAVDGLLAMVCHYRSGAMYSECASNLAATNSVLKSRVLPLFGAVADAGAGGGPGGGNKTKTVKFKKADKKLAPAVDQLKQTITRYGVEVAGGLLHRLYSDLAAMFQNLEAHDRAEIGRWVRSMQKSLQSYAGRMQAMCDSALDDEQLQLLQQELPQLQFKLERFDPLIVDKKKAAWVIVARRSMGG